ncbi:hypothetical protein NKH52_17520 [Mesorhizobium sp. M1066]
MHLQEPGDLGGLEIVVDELSRMRDLVGEGPNHIPRALAAIRRGAIK